MNRDVLRILDASLNRAAEAARVIEDYSRFALDDRDASRRIKALRHRLREIVASLDPARLLAARAIESDVGRELKNPAELTRDSTASAAGAAFGRLTEALRSIAEFGKAIDARAAAIAEDLRYAAYALEPTVMLRGTLRARFRAARLYVIVTEALCRGDWFETAEAALRGGAAVIQLREKDLADRVLLERARRLRDLTANDQALLVINDRPDIAALVHADGVHLGQDDLRIVDARRLVGGQMLIGRSTHTRDQIEAAAHESPDHVAVGPMFATTTKPQSEIAGVELLRLAASKTDLPLVAIGGIDQNRAAECFSAGASCVCVCSAVISADDPEAAARAIGRTSPAY